MGLVPNTGRSLLTPPPGSSFEEALPTADEGDAVGGKRKLDARH